MSASASRDGTDFLGTLQDRTKEILDTCTACGACAEACPMPDAIGFDVSDSETVTGGILDILKNGTGPEVSEKWANACTGSGHCLTVCEVGINPRFMLALARGEMLRQTAGDETASSQGKTMFRTMGQGVRVLSRLQLPPDLMARLGQARGERLNNDPADIIFYTGCNILKTPHIALLCLDVMDAMELDYVVKGGPAHCCGVYQFVNGDPDGTGRVAYNTIDGFRATGASEVLTWCPSCQVQLGDMVLPGYERTHGDPFDLVPFVKYLASRLDDLKPLFTRRVEKRVGLHEHPGIPGSTEAVRAILEAIPGLEFVDLEQPRVGYMCNTLNAVPDYKVDYHKMQLEAAEAAGVTTLAGIYHACHRELCSHERDWPFEVVNFMELIGEAMGIDRPDLFKRLKIMQDVDAILADSADAITDAGLKEDEVRDVILRDMLGEQTVPLRG